jgi:hypothetical protein
MKNRMIENVEVDAETRALVMRNVTKAGVAAKLRDTRTSDGYACEKPVKGGLSDFGRMVEAAAARMGV